MSKYETATTFVWTPEYSVHIPEIDAEHRVWFATVESLHQAMRAGEGKQRLASLLEEVIRYTQYHFAHEEAFMEAAGYSQLEAHRKQHARMTTVIRAFQLRFDRGEKTMTIELMQFLIFWLRRHTMSSDLDFGRFFKTAGLARSSEL